MKNNSFLLFLYATSLVSAGANAQNSDGVRDKEKVTVDTSFQLLPEKAVWLRREAHGHMNKGKALVGENHFRAASETYLQALVLLNRATELRDSSGQDWYAKATTCMALAHISNVTHKPADALQYFRSAVESYDKAMSDLNISLVKFNKAKALTTVADYEFYCKDYMGAFIDANEAIRTLDSISDEKYRKWAKEIRAHVVKIRQGIVKSNKSKKHVPNPTQTADPDHVS